MRMMCILQKKPLTIAEDKFKENKREEAGNLLKRIINP